MAFFYFEHEIQFTINKIYCFSIWKTRRWWILIEKNGRQIKIVKWSVNFEKLYGLINHSYLVIILED